MKNFLVAVFFISMFVYIVTAIYEAKMLALISLTIGFICVICLLIIGYKNLMK